MIKHNYTDQEIDAALAPVMAAAKVEVSNDAKEKFCRTGANRLCEEPARAVPHL